MLFQIQAQDIRVGNIVWLRENDEVPCDLVLIGTSDPQGICFVEVIIILLLMNFYSHYSAEDFASGYSLNQQLA